MSSRVLRKLHGDKDLVDELSDTETDTPIGGARKKQLNINRYDLLNQQSHSESEVKEDDNETEAPKSSENTNQELKRKKRKKKKKSGKCVNNHKSSEDNADIDEVERSVREVNKLLGETYDSEIPHIPSIQKCKKESSKGTLHIQQKHLNPHNELKRIFGSKVIQSEHKRRNRGNRVYTKSLWMTSCKENWPPISKPGLSMKFIETTNSLQYFSYEHSQSYKAVQYKFYEAVNTYNTNNIIALVNEYPYHIDALLQLSDFCKISEENAMAAELIERALYSLETAFHPLFHLGHGNCRLDYRRQENRALYIAAFKHLMFIGNKACCRTSLEFCKLIMSLDPENDPLAIILAMDFYAIRAKEYEWLKDFVREWESAKNLSQLPNFAFSLAVAHFYTSNGDTEKADCLLQDALLMFPGVLKLLLEKCSIQPDNRVLNHQFFNKEIDEPESLDQLMNLYVHRNYHLWKACDLMPWLEKNVQEVLDRVDAKEELVKVYREKRLRRYQGPLPLNVARHIIISDFKDFNPRIPNIEHASFDPLPPKDGINIYNQSKNQVIQITGQPVITFVRSLLPNYNPTAVEERNVGEGAAGLAPAENDGDLQGAVGRMLGAMRYLLNNIRAELPVDADIDENDETDEDYLT